MARNEDGGRSGAGARKTCLRMAEAAFFYRHRIPVPPGLRLPSGSGWAMSAMGYAVPPVPQGDRLQELIRLRRLQLTPEQLADPAYDAESPNWAAHVAALR